MLPSKTVYSLTREMYLAGCEQHIKTLTFLVLTLKQYVNVKITWGSEVRNINRNDDYCQPLMTYAASIQLILEVFTGEAACFRPESAFYPWSTVVSVHFTLSLHFIPGLQSLYFEKKKTFKGKTYAFTKIYCLKSGEIWASSINRYMPHKPQTEKYRRSVSLIII